MSVADKILENDGEEVLLKIRETSERILNKASSPISFSTPFLTRENEGVFFPNTINVIQGKSGVHKSRLVEMILSSVLTQDEQIGYIGFEREAEVNHFVSYIDTERNLSDQFPYAVQQIKLLSGFKIEDILPEFEPISLIDTTRENRFSVLEKYLAGVRLAKPKAHLFVVLDVITDCITNFNDPRESMKLIDLMNVMINEHNVTFLCVIHENPNSQDKARGHLGTELINKSSTVLQIGFEDKELDLIKVTFKKCRRTKTLNPFYLQYSQEENRLVIADQELVSMASNNRQQKGKVKDVIQELKILLIPNEPISKSDLFPKLLAKIKCSKRTLEDRLKQLLDSATPILSLNDRTYTLDKFTEGKKVFYGLSEQ